MTQDHRHTADDETVMQMLRKGMSSSEIMADLVVSSSRLTRLRKQLADAGVAIPARPGRAGTHGKGSNVEGAAKTRATKERQRAAADVRAVLDVAALAPRTTAALADLEAVTPIDPDDETVTVTSKYLRALEVIAELAREGVEHRAELQLWRDQAET